MAESPAKENLGDKAAKAKAAALLGTVVSGRYRIVELIAMGGVGAVYLAEHVHMHKHVAVKILHPDPDGLPDLIPRFEREAVAGAHIQHPNVAAATDFGKLDDGSCFLVLEYVKGTTLREVVKRGPVPPPRAARIGRQIAAALGAAHAMGIIHRDVKPRNVMLIEGERDVVKLIDFGLAKLALKEVSAIAANRSSFDEERITTSGAVFGTIAYLAPEAAMGMDTVDARADFYALGLVLYELLAGKHPFDVADPVELFRQHHKVKPPPIAQRAPGVVVPPALEAVVMRLLEKAPEDRYDDAAAVLRAIDEAIDTETPSAAPVQLGGALPTFAGPSIAAPPPEPLDASPPPVASTPTTPAARAAALPPPAARPTWPYAIGLCAIVALAIAGGVAVKSRASGAPAADASPIATSATSATQGPTRAETTAPPPAAPSTLSTPSTPSTTANAAASAAPSATAPAAPAAAPASIDVAQKRGDLRRFATAKDWPHASDVFFALVDHAPDGLHDPTLTYPVRDMAASLALAGGEPADKVFEALAQRAGADGPDILYELVRTRGGSKAAARALDLLAKPEVIARATPSLRVTIALREAPCPEKAGLLDRAVAEGDLRTLVVMETVAAACLGKSNALREAEKALRLKLH